MYTYLSTSEVPGAAFQGLLKSQLRKALGEMAPSLHDHFQICPLLSQSPVPAGPQVWTVLQMLPEATALQGHLLEASGHRQVGKFRELRVLSDKSLRVKRPQDLNCEHCQWLEAGLFSVLKHFTSWQNGEQVTAFV